MKESKILLAHGSGGKASHQLIDNLLLPYLGNTFLSQLDDSATLPIGAEKILFTTDSYVVDPPFFPGGDIGKLAVNGTINDLAVCGGKPLYLSLALILEEGLSVDHLQAIMQSVSECAKETGISIVTGDTKVVGRGGVDKIFINTAGIATLNKFSSLSPKNVKTGDKIIINGSIGDHGIAVLIQREGIELTSDLQSDTAPLHELAEEMLTEAEAIHFMRDPTRGGIATTLNEIAMQTGLGIMIWEDTIPIKPEVRGASELLGLDPLYIANEGKLIAVVSQHRAGKILDIMRNNRYGKEAAIIGEVNGELPGKVILNTAIGGRRIIDMLTGEQLPRIC